MGIDVKRYSLFSMIIVCLGVSPTFGQKGITTAGFQIKPIFSSDFLNTDSENSMVNGISYSIRTASGFSGGMVVRHGISERVSFETGISYSKRNYALSVIENALEDNGDFTVISYEIPLMGMVFIQLSENIWMTTALGGSVDMFPSDIFTSSDNYKHLSTRRGVLVPGFAANLGYEYRTEKSGYFYVGATFHRPFNGIYNSRIQYLNTDPIEEDILPLTGTYATVDFRYFFHQDPKRISKKEMSVKKKKRLYRKLDKLKEKENSKSVN